MKKYLIGVFAFGLCMITINHTQAGFWDWFSGLISETSSTSTTTATTPAGDLHLQASVISAQPKFSGDMVQFLVTGWTEGNYSTKSPRINASVATYAPNQTTPLYEQSLTPFDPVDPLTAIAQTGVFSRKLDKEYPAGTLVCLHPILNGTIKGAPKALTLDEDICTTVAQKEVDLAFERVDTATFTPTYSGYKLLIGVHFYASGDIAAEGVRFLAEISGSTLGLKDYPIGTLALGTTKTIELTGLVDQDYPRGTQICFSGSLVGNNETAALNNNTINVCTTYNPPVMDLAVTKITTESLQPEISGDLVTFRVYYINSGAAVTKNVNIYPVLSGVDFGVTSYAVGDLAAGASGSILFTGTTTNLFASGTQLCLSGDINFNYDEDDFLANNTLGELGACYTVTPAMIDIATATVATGSAQPEISGDMVSFTISYTNKGYGRNALAKGISFVGGISGTTLSNSTQSFSNLAIGDTGTVILTGLVTSGHTVGTEFCLSGAFSSSNENGDLSNNLVGPLCYSLADRVDLTLTGVLTPSTDQVLSGDLLDYVFTLTNIGGKQATGVNLLTRLSAGLTIISGGTWTGITLDAGQSLEYHLKAQLNRLPATGINLVVTGTTAFSGTEKSLTNNTTTIKTHFSGLADIYIQQQLQPFNGFRKGDKVVFILTYGNRGDSIANGVSLSGTISSFLTPTELLQWSFDQLKPGQTGSIVVTGTLNTFLSAGTVLSDSFAISTTSIQSTTGNDSTALNYTIPEVNSFSVDISVQNMSRSTASDNSQILVNALSGDILSFLITYANNGNVTGNGATINLEGQYSPILFSTSFANTIGALSVGQSGSLIVTGRIISKNFDTFRVGATLGYNGIRTSDWVSIQEPYACGDGLVTKNEPCDTLGQIGVLSGQVCQNQQGQCSVVTQYIVNKGCIVTSNGETCGDAVQVAIQAPTCMEVSVVPSGTKNTKVTCLGEYAANTPARIDCGGNTNGASIYSGVTDSDGKFSTTCPYTSATAAQTAIASCTVGAEETANTACKATVASCDLTINKDVVILSDAGKGKVKVSCETNDGKDANLQIKCGNDDQMDEEVFDNKVSYTCNYTDKDLKNDVDQHITCLVNKGNSSAIGCRGDVTLDDGLVGYCGDGHVDSYEECDDGSDNGTSDSTCTDGCDKKGSSSTVAECLSVGNGNLSIQDKEPLPFWWNLSNTFVNGDSCDGFSHGEIPRESTSCIFTISKNNKEVLEKTIFPCTINNRGSLPSSALNSLETLFPESTSAQARGFLGPIDVSTFGTYANTFGEYKLTLKEFSYKYCDDNKDLQDETSLDTVCETNFVITKPYLVQKSAFGLTPKATDISLDNVTTIDNQSIISRTDLDQVMVLDASNYAGGSKIPSMMNDFIDRASKLALPVTVSSSKLAGFTVKKVPNKMILIIEPKDGKHSAMSLKEFGSYTTQAFTIITKNIDVTIPGNIEHNGMFLVKGGNILFDESDDSMYRCQGPQTVRGIFVTDQSFDSNEKLVNSLTTPRCNNGGLYVKGVLIGKGIDTLVEKRRASLANWFHVSGSETSIATQRRTQIFNGAAVLIEYSPELWQNLPPGAEEFTQSLDVYKK